MYVVNNDCKLLNNKEIVTYCQNQMIYILKSNLLLPNKVIFIKFKDPLVCQKYTSTIFIIKINTIFIF